MPASEATPIRRLAIVNRGETEHDGLAQVTLRIEGDVGEVFPQAVGTALG